MTTRPMIFSGELAGKVNTGEKGVTRRPIKLPEWATACCDNPRRTFVPHNGKDAVFGGDNYIPYLRISYCENCDQCGSRLFARWKPGDKLWVREAWRVGAWDENQGKICVDYKSGNYTRKEWLTVVKEEMFERLWIQSSYDAIKAETDADGAYHWKPGEAPTRWRPSIHMPRLASRTTLIIKSVRGERLQDITEEEARREGFDSRSAFMEYWDAMYAKKPELLSSANPWVWRIEFERKE